MSPALVSVCKGKENEESSAFRHIFFFSKQGHSSARITEPDKSAWSGSTAVPRPGGERVHLEGVKGCGRAMRETSGVWARQQHFSVTAEKMENKSTEGVVIQHVQAHWARPVFG